MRRTLHSTAFVEGWAHYAEELCVEEGFCADDPRFAIGVWLEALIRVTRLACAIGVHTGQHDRGRRRPPGSRPTRTSAVPAALSEARRATFDPTYGRYTWGKLEIMDLRERARKQWGAGFTLRRFHAAMLSLGSPPLGLLGDPARLAAPGDEAKAVWERSWSSVSTRDAARGARDAVRPCYSRTDARRSGSSCPAGGTGPVRAACCVVAVVAAGGCSPVAAPARTAAARRPIQARHGLRRRSPPRLWRHTDAYLVIQNNGPRRPAGLRPLQRRRPGDAPRAGRPRIRRHADRTGHRDPRGVDHPASTRTGSTC